MNKLLRSGFTLVEMLMVIIIVGILAVVAIPQFVNYRVDARNAATSAALGALRSAIQIQYSQIAARCNPAVLAYPPVANINANDITSGGSPCTAAQVVLASDRAFIPNGIPVNPWGATPSATVTACTNCNPALFDGGTITTACDGVNFTGGWCYNVATGAIWADSASNGGTVGGTLEPNL